MSLSLEPKNLAHFILHDNTLLSLKSEESIREYSISKLKEYYYHSLLYASDDVMRAMKGFISEPSRVNYIRTAQKMRTDLWGKKTKLTEKELLEP